MPSCSCAVALLVRCSPAAAGAERAVKPCAPLFVVPAFYMLIARDHNKARVAKPLKPVTIAPPAAGPVLVK